MYTRHNEVPVFEQRTGVVKTAHYNRVMTAFNRLGGEIRLVIPRLRTLDLILQKDAWVIVDRAFNDLPISAWVDFDSLHRDALHTPVKCQLKLYHANADIIIKQVLESMELLLGEQLMESHSSHQVLHFPEGH